MGTLVRDQVVHNTLRTDMHVHEVYCSTELTLQDAMLGLLQRGAREEYLFLMDLFGRIRTLDDVSTEIRDRFLLCESKILPSPDGDPLVLCAITNGVMVGFPTEPVWDKDQITVTFKELLDNEDIEEVSETIDNLARSSHARPVCDRHHARVRGRWFRNGAALWSTRGEVFPNLIFGPDVEGHLAALDAGLLGTVANKLATLNESARSWRDESGSALSWRTKVTDESDSVKNDDRLREARRFRSNDGTRRLFLWHARFGSSGRIHLRFDTGKREIEIGYVGHHLLLK